MNSVFASRRSSAWLGAILLLLWAGPVAGRTPELDPKEFGIQQTNLVVSATAFSGACRASVSRTECFDLYISPSFGRYALFLGQAYTYYATLDLPAGAIVDDIGLNSTTDTAGALTASLLQRDRSANVATLASVSSTVHGWDTDYSAPLSLLIPDHADKELVLKVEQAPEQADEFFAWVEVRWHRTVSPPPDDPSFNDVPMNHPFFLFIEALRSSGITGGCGDGTNYCPDTALTRGQMAVFLSKALGLHWPN